MTDTSPPNDLSTPRRDRPNIALPNGDTLEPRSNFAARLNVSERTVQRMRLPTMYIGNVAHHPVKESLSIIEGRIRRPNEPRGRRQRAPPR
jgi:hypothetical protein